MSKKSLPEHLPESNLKSPYLITRANFDKLNNFHMSPHLENGDNADLFFPYISLLQHGACCYVRFS